MEELSIFDFVKTPLKIDKPIRLIELFAGIGSQAKALKRLGANFEHYRVCDFDKYAIKSYNAVHDTDFVTSDITQITADDLGIMDTDKYTYLMTYSFPCQDLSLAGKGKGMAKGDNTRSGLLWEVERLLNECTELPQILLMENVTQVHGKKNKEHFDEWIAFLESKGYSNYWKDLNAKNFGIPQNRNRTFMVSVLGDYSYEFPQEFPLALRLKDMLEDSVDEKFYLSGKLISGLQNFNSRGTGIVSNQGSCFEKKTDVANTLMARDYKGFGNQGMNCVIEPTCEQAGILTGGKWDKMHDVSRRVYSENGIAPTIHTCGGGNTEPKVIAEPKIEKVLQLEGSHEQSGRVYSPNGISPTIMSNSHGNTSGGYVAPKVIAGIGEKKSNGGKQWYQQDRIYDDKVAISVTTAFNPYYMVNEPFICASRGRNPENPSDRTAGAPTEQRLEPNFSGCTNTLTTVQKDNYVANGMRIRKLTPKECWRLMGFDDADFERAAAVNSNSQLYKQAGNSIVVDVLYYIFREML